MPITVAAIFKAETVLVSSNTGIVNSNRVWFMMYDGVVLCYEVLSGIVKMCCDGPVYHPRSPAKCLQD
jgi:hypothetical protein